MEVVADSLPPAPCFPMPTDDLDRDKLYADDADDDDFEYELEPPDPTLVDAEKRRAEEVAQSVRQSIDIDEVYRDLDARRDSEILEQWAARIRNYRFQFQLKHLLIFTAVIAVLLTLFQMGVNPITFVVVSVMLAVGGVTIYLQWEEKKRQDAADRRRQQMYAERRAAMQGAPAPAQNAAKPIAAAPLPADELEIARRAATAKPFRFNFSLAQFMVAFTCAALLFGLIHMLGGMSQAATLCGFIALVGLAVHAFGYEPPEVVTFVWWVMLLMYVVLSISAAIWANVAS